MPELVKLRRIIFRKGKQEDFLNSVKCKLGLTQTELAKLVGISVRNLSDWKREKITLPLVVAELLSKKSDIPLPKGVKLVDPYWYTKKAGAIGAKVVLEKYGRLGGNAEVWREKWQKWWKQKGRFSRASPVGRSKTFNKPKRGTKLAEFIGVILGDGSISNTQVVITLHSIDDKEYSAYIRKSIRELFAVEAGTFKQKHALAESIYISRTALIAWLGNSHSLKVGSKVKQQADVPAWVKDNLSFSKACVRGLMDTDGCVFSHSYVVSGKRYTYIKLHFTNASRPLVYFVYETLSRLGLHPRLARKDGEVREVRLDRKMDIQHYFKLIGTHNPKFLKRWQE